MKKSLLVLLSLAPFFLFGQHLFKEKFQDYITDQFALESDSADAKMNALDFINTIIIGIGEKTLAKVEGIIKLQVLVDMDGRSCLLSIENETNVSSAKLNLKKNIDEKLIWGKPTKKVSPLIFLRFKDGKVGYKRMGLNGNTGLHEIVE